MNKPSLSIIFAALYLLFFGIFFASELYTRIYDTGNSAMAGLVSYFLTMPSSLLIDWISVNVFGAKIGNSNVAFVLFFVLSAILNATIIYFIVKLLVSLARK
jgi:hypothetical protein